MHLIMQLYVALLKVMQWLSDQDTGFNVGPHNVTGYIKVDADELALWKDKYLRYVFFSMTCLSWSCFINHTFAS